MRVVIQRVKGASVTVANETIGSIENGLLILLGIEHEDTTDDIQWLCKKIVGLRIFDDRDGKMNLPIKEVKGDILVVSQFTLFASTIKGNRPSFMRSASPERANDLYRLFVTTLETLAGCKVPTGKFGAMMDVSLVNDGPVTILMDSKNKE